MLVRRRHVNVLMKDRLAVDRMMRWQRPSTAQNLWQVALPGLARVQDHRDRRREVGRKTPHQVDEGFDPACRSSDDDKVVAAPWLVRGITIGLLVYR